MKRLIITSIAVCFSFFTLNAQTQERPFSLGISGGLTQYNGDLGNGDYDFSQIQYGHIGLDAAWYVSPHFDFVMNATYGGIGYNEHDHKSFSGKQYQYNAHFNLNILNSDTHKIIPYILGGIGAAYYPKNYEILKGVDLFANFGAGIRFKLTDRIDLHLQESYAYTDHDDRDGDVHNINDGFLMHNIGISYSFSGGKDSDNDGVKDKHDNCPNTPPNVKVDEKGCPLDRDGDGIADYLDACPDQKGTIAMKGCPDKDGDLVADSIDRCPDVAGSIAMKGCPDKDGDGIADIDDKCPDVAGVKELDGCPLVDTDMDGISDKEDACPTEKGPAITKGCPDKDNDGVADKDDKCPDVPGLISNSGCPSEQTPAPVPSNNVKAPKAPQGSQTGTKEIKQILHFESGKNVLTETSKKKLDAVSKILLMHADYSLSIEGFTDNVGTPESNLTLSKARAEIAKTYLTDKGIAASRLTTNGYGQDKPISDNATDAGRLNNRRVEFKVN